MGKRDGNSVEASTDRSLSCFDKPSYEEWKEAALLPLKGAPFEKKLIGETLEEIQLNPIYNEDALQDLGHLENRYGLFNRKSDARNRADWEICQKLVFTKGQNPNEILKRDISRGATSVVFELDYQTRQGLDSDESYSPAEPSNYLSLANVDDIESLLKGVDLKKLRLNIAGECSILPFLALLLGYLDRSGQNKSDLKGFVGLDPLGASVASGALLVSLESLFDEIKIATGWAASSAPGLKTVGVSSTPYHDAGANAVQEVAFSLATSVTYIKELMTRGLTLEQILPRMMLEHSVGSDLFTEIAKLRATRVLFAMVVDAFSGSDSLKRCIIHAKTSSRTQTELSPHTNMLRGTTQAFSASIAGADVIQVEAFDHVFGSLEELGRRIAQNVQAIFKDESHFNHVTDPVGGSYYVEQLTGEIAKRSWDLFREIESMGGMKESLKKGHIQSVVAQTTSARHKQIGMRKQVIVGTNRFFSEPFEHEEKSKDSDEFASQKRAEQIQSFRDQRDMGELNTRLKALETLDRAKEEALIEGSVYAALSGATLKELRKALGKKSASDFDILPFKRIRDAASYENLHKKAARLKEKRGASPTVFLANMGPLVQHKARTDFSTDFFKAGGFEVIDSDGFEDPLLAAQKAVESKAHIAVICSTDATYPALVPPFADFVKKHKKEMIIVLAGLPKDEVENLAKAGVDEFVHIRSNNYEMLKGLLNKIGESHE